MSIRNIISIFWGNEYYKNPKKANYTNAIHVIKFQTPSIYKDNKS